MDTYFLYLLALSPTEQYKPAKKQQFEYNFQINGNKLPLFITMAVLSASFSNRMVKFQDSMFAYKKKINITMKIAELRDLRLRIGQLFKK